MAPYLSTRMKAKLEKHADYEIKYVVETCYEEVASSCGMRAAAACLSSEVSIT